MGKRGPTPKRNSGRLRKNESSQNVELAGVRIAPPIAPRNWHGQVRYWFAALVASPQSQVFTAADWQVALTAGREYDRYLKTPPAQRQAWMLDAFTKAQDSLLASHAARLRSHVEIFDAAPDGPGGGNAVFTEEIFDLRRRYQARQAGRQERN